MLRDYRSSALPEKDKALFAFVVKVNKKSYEIQPADVEAARQAGCSEETLYDAITVCALFNFYNRWCDAAGVQDMPKEAYAASGKRLAQHGYIRG
ncbi:MAG TPA: carboxymuconolactone decarboxylase family protein [Terriglobales bacterium]|nr:carboxymuconolactone decarboxylase family protein [Terriglobales bacterium]